MNLTVLIISRQIAKYNHHPLILLRTDVLLESTLNNFNYV